jgi:hypothetical protein
LVLGGPGTCTNLHWINQAFNVIVPSGVGKTTVLSRITQLCAEYELPLVCAAMTGVLAVSSFTACKISHIVFKQALQQELFEMASLSTPVLISRSLKTSISMTMNFKTHWLQRKCITSDRYAQFSSHAMNVPTLLWCLLCQFHNVDEQLNEGLPLGVFLDEFSMIPANMLGQV